MPHAQRSSASAARSTEDVRSDGRTFAIATNHEDPELDRLVVEHAGYSIVAMLPGEPAQIALDSDPRKA